MNRWFRAYDSSKDDPKLLLLSSDTLRWQWFVLLCVASQHEGKIPSLEVAALGLRLPPVKAARVIAALHRAILLDETPGGYFHPHNWTGRQYKSDQDPTRNERQRRHRDTKRNALRNGQSNGDVTDDVTRTETENRIQKEDDDDAGARPLISQNAHRLSDEITKIAGHDLAFVPPSWFGAPYRAQQWLNQGWPEELILLSVREQAAKKRDGPANSIRYFEPGIASAIARQNQPLPVASITEIPRNDRNGSTAKSGLAAIDRIFDRIESRPGISAPADENVVLSLPARSIP